MRVPTKYIFFLLITLNVFAFNAGCVAWDGAFPLWFADRRPKFAMEVLSCLSPEDRESIRFPALTPENDAQKPSSTNLPQPDEAESPVKSDFLEELLDILHGFAKTTSDSRTARRRTDGLASDRPGPNEASNIVKITDNPVNSEPVLTPTDGEPEILFLNWFDNKGHFHVMDMLERAAPSAPADPQHILMALQDPVFPAVCLSPFGAERSGSRHLGMDLQGSPGTPVIAVADGRVVFAGRLSGFEAYGRIVVIDHGQGIFSLYGHVKPVKNLLQSKRRGYAPVGVHAGERVAVVGATTDGESSSGPHLHFELLMVSKEGDSKRFALLNPARYLLSFKDEEAKAVQASLGAKKKRRSGPLNKLNLKAEFGRGIFCVLKTLEPVCPNLTGQFSVPAPQRPERCRTVRLFSDNHPTTLKKLNPGRFRLLKKMEAFCGMHQDNSLCRSHFNSPALFAVTSGFYVEYRSRRFLLPRFLPVFRPDRL